jgi:hypothetical protein
MKKSLLTFWLFSLFIATNLKAQDCLPETRMEDPTENKAAAKALKNYLMDSKEGILIKWKGKAFPKEIDLKCEYLRHTFLNDWKVDNNMSGDEIRYADLALGVKSKTGQCAVVFIQLYSIHLGAGRWGPMTVTELGFTGNEKDERFQKYFNENADCACVLKTYDWLNPGSNANVSNNNSSSNTTSNTNNTTTTETKSTSSPGISKDVSGLPALDKKKPGYFEEKDGNVVSAQGYKKGGKIDGEYRSYSDGKMEYSYTYKNGIKEGPAAEYWENGKVKESGMYKNDAKDGEWKRFSEAGKAVGTDTYVDGEKQ